MPWSTPPRRGPDADILARLFDGSALAPRLDEPQRGAVLAVLTAPVLWSWIAPPRRCQDVATMEEVLKQSRIPEPAVAAWLRGLVKTGHTEATLADLEAAGVLVRWGVGRDSGMTLTPLAARQIGVELRPVGRREPPAVECWGPLEDLRKRRPIVLDIRDRVAPAMDQERLWLVVSAEDDPYEQAVAAERWARRELVLDPVSGEVLELCGAKVYREHRVDHPLKGLTAPPPSIGASHAPSGHRSTGTDPRRRAIAGRSEPLA